MSLGEFNEDRQGTPSFGSTANVVGLKETRFNLDKETMNEGTRAFSAPVVADTTISSQDEQLEMFSARNFSEQSDVVSSPGSPWGEWTKFDNDAGGKMLLRESSVRLDSVRENLDTSDEDETPYSSLTEMILPVADGKTTDDKLEQQQLFQNSQDELENLCVENKKLKSNLERLQAENETLDERLKEFFAAGGVGDEITQLKDKLEAAQAEIKILSDQSELVQVYNSLRAEVARTREDYCKCEERAADAESEKEILENEISTERDINQNLRGEVAKLTAALRYYETKYPQGDAEGLFDSSMKPEKDGEIVEQLKTEITDLQAKIRQKEAAVKGLTKSRRTVESRFQRLQEEGDRLAEQIVSLVAMRDNLKRELKDAVKLTEQLQEDVLAKETEAEGWRREKEKMIKEIQDLQDDLETRRQEVAMVTEDYEQTVAEGKSKAYQWRVQHQQYEEDFRTLDRQFNQLTHESQERELRLTLKLDQKVDELQNIMDNAVERQLEFDAICEQLKQELDEVKTDRDRYQEERDRYKDERDTWKEEYNMVLHIHEKRKEEHKAKITELDHQYSVERETWLADKSNMDRVITKQVQQLQLAQRQTDIVRDQLEHDAARLSEELLNLRQQLQRDGIAKYHLVGDELQPYEMTDVDPVQGSKFKDHGSNGYVSLVRVCGGVKCIEKRIHDILIGRGGNEDVGREQRGQISEKFYKECVTLSQMRHPNVVQFVGVQYHRDNSLSLIMEYLPMSMDKCLARCNLENFSIPLCFKLSILRDIAYGLLHLHVHQIVHRDLSAGNILLTSDLRAKIADLGMSRHLNPATMSKLTPGPGALYVMPPEAFEANCQYTNKIDIFSFGVLSLELMLQKCPSVLNSGITTQHVENKEVDIGKRIQSIEEVSHLCQGEVKSIVCTCLQDVPDKRPPALRLKDRFEHLCHDYPNEMGDTIAMLQAINKLEANKLQVP